MKKRVSSKIGTTTVISNFAVPNFGKIELPLYCLKKSKKSLKKQAFLSFSYSFLNNKVELKNCEKLVLINLLITTTNLGKFLEEWQQQEQSSPSYPAITTQAQMDKANTGATNVFGPKGFNFTNPPIITGGNTSLVAIPAFLHGGNEHDHYFFHPDHLGSSNYITNFAGELSQHI